LLLAAAHRTGARHQQNQTCIIALVHWQARQLPPRHDVADRGLLGLQERCPACDLDHFSEVSDLQSKIDFQHRPDFEDDTGANLLFETGRFDLNGVDSRVQRGDAILPGLVCLHLTFDARSFVNHCHRDVGRDGTARVGDIAHDCGGSLSVNAGWTQKPQSQQHA
jgi:hypothetical protein